MAERGQCMKEQVQLEWQSRMTVASLTVRCYGIDASGMRHESEQLPSYP